MTTTTENQAKQIPAFYIFAKGADGQNNRVGAVFKHGKGSGLNILIGNARYVAFAPKAQSNATEGGR